MRSFIGDPTPVLINCTIEDAPGADLTIRHNDNDIKKGKNPLYLWINVTKKEDFGIYECLVQDIGDREEIASMLHVVEECELPSSTGLGLLLPRGRLQIFPVYE